MNNLNIEFFGNSICGRQVNNTVKTFVDIIIDHFRSTNRWIGFGNCSEERILYNLKKSKIDKSHIPTVAVVFHSDPSFVFCPALSNDYKRLNESELVEKFNYALPKYYPNWRLDNINSDEQPVDVDSETARIAFLNYYKFFTTPEANLNRYYGSLIQIDQFCSSKHINVIHCPQFLKDIPPWFKFTTGIIDNEIGSYQNSGSSYSCTYSKSDNAVTQEGNDIIAETLIKYINSLMYKQ